MFTWYPNLDLLMRYSLGHRLAAFTIMSLILRLLLMSNITSIVFHKVDFLFNYRRCDTPWYKFLNGLYYQVASWRLAKLILFLRIPVLKLLLNSIKLILQSSKVAEYTWCLLKTFGRLSGFRPTSVVIMSHVEFIPVFLLGLILPECLLSVVVHWALEIWCLTSLIEPFLHLGLDNVTYLFLLGTLRVA
jgi:hypothetical protein